MVNLLFSLLIDPTEYFSPFDPHANEYNYHLQTNNTYVQLSQITIICI